VLGKKLTFKKSGNLGAKTALFGLNCTKIIPSNLHCTKMPTIAATFRYYVLTCFRICSSVSVLSTHIPWHILLTPMRLLVMCYTMEQYGIYTFSYNTWSLKLGLKHYRKYPSRQDVAIDRCWLTQTHNPDDLQISNIVFSTSLHTICTQREPQSPLHSQPVCNLSELYKIWNACLD
jgi:hypothetical protein